MLRILYVVLATVTAASVVEAGHDAVAVEGDVLDRSRRQEGMTNQRITGEIAGKRIRWTWTEGPVAGTTHEHEFNEDGTVVWRVLDGPRAGHSATEKEYAALKVSDDVVAVSYLAESGYTLTVVLDFGDNSMVGFASGASEWYPMEGTFEVME